MTQPMTSRFTLNTRSQEGLSSNVPAERVGVLLPLARTGYDVTGLDVNYNMLEVLKTKLKREKPEVRKRVHLVKGDMRDFKLHKTFAMGYIAIASFLHNLTVQDEEACVRCMFEHFRPDLLWGPAMLTPFEFVVSS